MEDDWERRKREKYEEAAGKAKLEEFRLEKMSQAGWREDPALEEKQH